MISFLFKAFYNLISAAGHATDQNSQITIAILFHSAEIRKLLAPLNFQTALHSHKLSVLPYSIQSR